MTPFIPLQFISVKTDLTMEQAIAILGRSLVLKRETNETGEIVSFRYQPERAVKYQSMGSVTVYVKYFSNPSGVHVKVTVMPNLLTMLFLALGFVFTLSFEELTSTFASNTFPVLLWLFFYLFNWWETVDTKRTIQSLFHTSIRNKTDS